MNKKILFLLAIAIPFLTMGAGCTKQKIDNKTSVDDNTSSTAAVVTSSQQTSKPETIDETLNWKTKADDEHGFAFKYPNNFFDSNQEPKILVGDCDYNIFLNTCPSINDIVIKDSEIVGGNIKIIKNNTSTSDNWENSKGEKLAVNNHNYCLYQTKDAGMGHVYTSYYYLTVKNQKCLVTYLITNTSNCEYYLPLEKGNVEQQKNYNDCLTTNQNQPKILKQILSTFEFSNDSAGKEVGYIKNIYEKAGKNYLDIDYIQWLNSEECLSKKIDAPSGFCILNQETKIRTFEISKNVEIRMQTFSHTTDGNYNWNEKISYEQFKTIFSSAQSQKNVPYNIKFENNTITKITEQYVP